MTDRGGPRIDLQTVTKVAVFRALKLGDMLCAIPALLSIRRGLPTARIELIGLAWAREFAARFPHLIDDFREFPGWPGLPETTPRSDRIAEFLREMQGEKFDLAIQLHGSGRIANQVIEKLAARQTAGFYPGDGSRPPSDLFLSWPEEGLEVRRLLALTEFLGFPFAGEHLEFPLGAGDLASAKRLIDPAAGPYACIHPGASEAARRWPAERFAAIADSLAAKGLRIVLTGTESERHLACSVAGGMKAPAVDLAGRTSLSVTAAVLERARLIVCNDTGVSHLAAAVGTPSVVISTAGNPERWSPIDADRHRVLCEPGGWPDVSWVLAHALELLGTGTRERPAPLPERASRPPRLRRVDRVPSLTGSPGSEACPR